MYIVITYACWLLPFGAAALAVVLGAPWWVAMLVFVYLFRAVAFGFRGPIESEE